MVNQFDGKRKAAINQLILICEVNSNIERIDL